MAGTRPSSSKLRRDLVQPPTGMSSTDVEACFSSGITGLEADSHRVSVAKLSEIQILKLLNHSGHPRAQVLLKRPLVISGCTEIQYKINLDAKRPDEKTLELRISHLRSVDAAQASMKRYLATSDRKLSDGVTASPDKFGHCSLENRSTIFWWYLRHFVRVSVRSSTGPDLATARVFSKTLNDHLVESEADENALISVQPAIDGPASVTIVQRSIVQLRLRNLENTGVFQRCWFSDPMVCVVDRGPTPDGVVDVYGNRPGTTQLFIAVAHAEYLTVTTVEFALTVEWADLPEMYRRPQNRLDG